MSTWDLTEEEEARFIRSVHGDCCLCPVCKILQSKFPDLEPYSPEEIVVFNAIGREK